MVILGVNSSFSTIAMSVWSSSFFPFLVYPITLFSSIPRRGPRINARYTRLVVRVQLALVSVREIE